MRARPSSLPVSWRILAVLLTAQQRCQPRAHKVCIGRRKLPDLTSHQAMVLSMQGYGSPSAPSGNRGANAATPRPHFHRGSDENGSS